MGSLSDIVDLTFPTVPNMSNSLSDAEDHALYDDYCYEYEDDVSEVGNEEVGRVVESNGIVDNNVDEELVMAEAGAESSTGQHAGAAGAAAIDPGQSLLCTFFEKPKF